MEPPPSQGRWSKKDIRRLLLRIENNLLSSDNPGSEVDESQPDWEKIAFQGFSGDVCKLKWTEICSELGKFQPLAKVVQEARKLISSRNGNNGSQKHPDFPKRPLTAYFRFYKEQRLQYSQKYPQMNNHELAKILAGKYRQLPQEVKQKYTEEYWKDREEFEEKVAQFWQNHPDQVQSSKKSGGGKRSPNKAPKNAQDSVQSVRPPSKTNAFGKYVKFHGEPAKPPMTAYSKFQDDWWSKKELEDLSPKERRVEIGRRWHRVPPALREQYRQQAEELQRHYWVDLDLWLKGLSPEEYAAYKKRSSGKGKIVTSPGDPNPSFSRRDLPPSPATPLQEEPGKENGPQTPGTDAPGAVSSRQPHSPGSEKTRKEPKEEDGISSDSSNEDEDEDMNLTLALIWAEEPLVGHGEIHSRKSTYSRSLSLSLEAGS
ncbi:upstream-binding factor 1-like protein 1 [Octodon degus]|uniref:Upstream-binding factor 1-like protein 1 n=1 Tax=Octodon degus TaxID=10160 RepID=A0A6P3FP17_OCTDE|nr:upstream-binding factor 1-like protein 1 [Octodon degus]